MIITASSKALKILQNMLILKGHEHLRISKLHTLETITVIQTVLSAGVAHVTIDLDEHNKTYELEQPAFDLLITRENNELVNVVILQGTYTDVYGRPSVITEASLSSEFDEFLEYVSDLFFTREYINSEQVVPFLDNAFIDSESYDAFDLGVSPDNYDEIPDYPL